MQKFPFEAETLRRWFLKEARDLPWRKDRSPYAVWVSEVMLQQTQVAVVQDYYLRWMERFPSIESLASASVEEVIKMWEGLGYYSRARHLHAAAKEVVEKYGGCLPSSAAELAKIKGLGPYTIGAILSFAFEQRAAAVDGNTIRVLTRYFGIEEDIGKGSTLKKIWEIAQEVLPEDRPWEVVEALIELGASVCKRQPQCWSCPLRQGCSAFKQGVQAELPKKSKKVAITILKRAVFVIECQGELLLKKGVEGKVMADLYEFPYCAVSCSKPPFLIEAKKMHKLPEVVHSFTRYKVRLYPTFWRANRKTELSGHRWVPWKETAQYPFSSGHRKILELMGEHAAITH